MDLSNPDIVSERPIPKGRSLFLLLKGGNMAIVGHTGSWGTPELFGGLTERVGDFFGLGRTSQGGSTVRGVQDTYLYPRYSDQGSTTGSFQILENSYNPNVPETQRNVRQDTNRGPNNTDTVPNPTPQPTPEPTPDNGPSPYEQYLNNLYASLGSAYNKMQSDLEPMYQNRQKNIENMAASQLSNIDLQQQAGLDTLGTQREGITTNQVRNLKDLSNAISQSYNTFANQLGNMGAGDSSASRVMLPYALSRTEAQQRGQINRTTADKLGDIDARETQLKNTVMQEKNNLEQAKMSELAQLGEWFDNAKMQISQMRLADARAAGENALNLALQQMQRIQSNYDNRQAALDSWAISNSQNLAQLRQNMGAMTDPSLVGKLPTYNLSSLGANQGMTTSASQAPVGFGYGNTEDIFKKLGVV